MKLRIQDNNFRIRLSVEELDKLAMGESIEMKSPLSYSKLIILLIPGVTEAEINLEDKRFTINVPQAKIKELQTSNEEGFKLSIKNNDLNSTLLIEKDFKCIGREDDLNKGLFPNPNSSESC